MNYFDINATEITHEIVAENEKAFAILVKMPIVPGHTIIIPKRVVPSSQDLTEQEWSHILHLKNIVYNQLKNHLGAEGFNFAWDEKEIAGQTVSHFTYT